MKTPIIAVVACACTLPLGASDPTLSPDAKAQIKAATPAYDPSIHAAEVARKAAEATPPEDEIVVLPEMTVQEKSLRRMQDEDLYRRGAWDKELVKRELSDFDRFFLNRYTIPLFGISKEERARQAYLERKNREFQERIKNFSQVLRTTDDKEAAELETIMLDTARSGSPAESHARPSNWR